MKPFLKLECPHCGGKYYIDFNNPKNELPPEIELGEAFPFKCPLCKESDFSVVVDPREGRIYRWRR